MKKMQINLQNNSSNKTQVKYIFRRTLNYLKLSKAWNKVKNCGFIFTLKPFVRKNVQKQFLNRFTDVFELELWN